MRSLCVIVPKSEGERVRKKLLEMDNLRKDLIIESDEKSLYLPIQRSVNMGYKISEREFKEARVTIRSYIDVMDIPDELKACLPTSFDLIGEIAVIKIPDRVKEFSSDIGKAILEVNKSVRTVASDEGVMGDFRVRRIKVIAGEKNTRTVHKEYGLKLVVDIAKAYFSPRLATERQRVMRKVKEGELIIDMFCGVGSFSIAISKNVPSTKIYGIDSNPYAINCFIENIRINKVENVIPIEGDVKQLITMMEPADRIIMDLPKKSFEFFDDALGSLKRGGMIHYYEILDELDLAKRESQLSSIAERQDRKLKIQERRVVHGYSPNQNQYAFDIIVY